MYLWKINEKQNKFFGRNKYISPVIFDGTENNIKIVKVKFKPVIRIHCLGQI